MKQFFALYAACLLLACLPAIAQDSTRSSTSHYEGPSKYKSRTYFTWGGDGAILSFAQMKSNGNHVRNIPRFSAFLHIGVNINHNFSNNFGIFTGISLKNIGLINDATDSLRLKRRVYTLGIPIGFKIGNLRRYGVFFFAGGAYDLALNYKEKQFVNGHKERKYNEWFSDRTPILMPSIFAGLRASPGFGLKVQYYPTNFFNQDYSKANVKPYQGLDAKLFFVTISYDFARINARYSKHRSYRDYF